MILFTEEQIININKLNPLTDSKFTYDVNRWANLNQNFKYLIQDFENIEISRKNVIDAFDAYFKNEDNSFIKPFLLSMVWGFSNTGYGTHRTNNYISVEENRTKIKNALDFINDDKNDSLKKAYKELKKIKGLGISYITKVLYFATRAKKQKTYSLIFDIRVAAALLKLTTPKEIYEIVNVGPSSKFSDYEKYNILLRNIANTNDIEPEQLEMYLFNQDF